jgi:hypothetical protein
MDMLELIYPLGRDQTNSSIMFSLITNMELLQNIILYQLYRNGHVRINIYIGKRSSTFIFEFSGIAWNEHGMNDNFKGPMEYIIDAA